VEFKDLSFNFPGQKNKILNKIDLSIDEGSFIGIVGKSGSGKSTLMKLLARLYAPTNGKIFIDNFDIDKVELYSLRRQIGIVPQEPLLFSGTIRENIAINQENASDEDIIKASKIACADGFIMEMSEGYNTKIGERGASISGGQKQRIAIARTILANPKLIVLDEATSALDYETETNIFNNINKEFKSSTIFCITHRLPTVIGADQIIFLQNGSIVEKGTHKELISNKGNYFSLYNKQKQST
jgi:ATP-binding cassette subfamily B protein